MDELTLNRDEQLARRDIEYAKLLQWEARERNMQDAIFRLEQIARIRDRFYLLLSD